MDEKLTVAIVGAAVIVPICAVCILGPAAIVALFAGAVGWLGGFGPLATVALMIAAGAMVTHHILRKKTRALPDHEGSAGGQARRPSPSSRE